MRKESIRFVASNVASRDLFALSNHGFSSVISVSCAFSSTVCPQGAIGLFGLLLKPDNSHCALDPQAASGQLFTGEWRPALSLASVAPHPWQRHLTTISQTSSSSLPFSGPRCLRKMLFCLLKVLCSSFFSVVSCLQFKNQQGRWIWEATWQGKKTHPRHSLHGVCGGARPQADDCGNLCFSARAWQLEANNAGFTQ